METKIHFPLYNNSKLGPAPSQMNSSRLTNLCDILLNARHFYGEGLVSAPLSPPNTDVLGPLLVGCSRPLIQYIRSYPPYLEAVSTIRMPRTRHAMVT
jgi:hypothetical protein